MAHKQFQGQLSGEKVLCKIREHFISFAISHIWDILLFSTGIALLIGIGWYFFPGWAMILLGGFCYAMLALVYKYYHYSNVFVITSRRVIKHVFIGFWETHVKELRLESIKQLSSVRESIWDHFFRYGSLLVNPGMDTLSVRGIALHHEIANYLSWLVDYVEKHGISDEVRPFMPRKERSLMSEEAY